MTWKRGVTIAIIILAIGYPVAWLLVRNSDAFAEANRFLQTHPAVKDYVGQIHSITLSPFIGEISVSGATGMAKLELNVSGEKQRAEIYIELEKKGIWEVRFARLLRQNDSPVQLL